MNYTMGNWTIESLVTDSIETSKNIPVVDLDYDNDFTLSKSTDEEVILVNITGQSLESPESIRFGKTRVQDIYAGLDIPAPNRISAKQGVRTLCEIRLHVRATNSVSGDEIILPFRGWICLQVPTASMVTPQAIEYLLNRTYACALKTGSVDATRVTEVARGDLSPL